MKYIKSFSALQIHCPIDTVMHKDMEQMRKMYKNLFPLATEKTRSSEGKCWFRVQEPHLPCVHFHVVAASSCIPSFLNYATNLRLSVKSFAGRVLFFCPLSVALSNDSRGACKRWVWGWWYFICTVRCGYNIFVDFWPLDQMADIMQFWRVVLSCSDKHLVSSEMLWGTCDIHMEMADMLQD